MNLYALVPLFSAFVLTGFLFNMKARQTSKLNNIFIVLTTALLFWNLGDFLTWTVLADQYILVSFRVLSVCWLSIGLLSLVFIYQIIERKSDKTLKLLCTTTGLSVILSVFTDFFVTGFTPTFWGKMIIPGQFYLSLIIVAVFIPLAYCALLIIITLRHKMQQNIRKSLKMVLYGLIASMIVAFSTDIVIPHFFNRSDFIHLGSSSSVIFCFFLLLAVNRYKFLNITLEDLAEDLFMTSTEGVVIFDNNGLVKKINPAALAILQAENQLLETIDLNKYLINYDLSAEYTGYETKTAGNRFVAISQSKIVTKINTIEGSLLLIKDISDKKDAETVLLSANNQLENEVIKRTSELVLTKDFLESIFNTIKDAIIVVDAQGHIVRCNEQFYKLFHYQPVEVKNKIFDMLFSEDDLNKFNKKLLELNQTEQFALEANILLQSGEENPVYISTSILKYSQITGAENQLLIVISDISKRKKAETKLLESHRLARMIIENFNETIMVIQDGLIKYFVNQKFTEHSFDDVKNKPFEEFIHPDFRAMVKQNYFDRMNGKPGVPSIYQIQIINKNGIYLWTEVNVVEILWEKKNATLVYLRDINKQKQTEEQLVENEKLFRAFIDQANDFILIKSRDGKYLKTNKKFCWLIGKTEAEIAGKTPKDIGYGPGFVQEIDELDHKIIENKVTLVRESEAKKAKKIGLEWLEETMFPILEDNNEVKYIGVISRDITQKKRAEQELSIQNEQLQEAYKKLQESYKIIINQEKLASLGTMAAGIAHEINNPTQAIKFSMQSLKLNLKDLSYFLDECKKIKKSSPEEYPALLENINKVMVELELDVVLNELGNIATENEKSVDRIHNIIQSTSRLSYHEQEMRPCDLKQVVNDVLILLHNNLKYQITVKKVFGENLPNVLGVHQQLEQVMINLVNNARDSMLEKGLGQTDALLLIKLDYNPNTGLVEASVTDHGNGIADEILNKIYDPFFTTKKLGSGTGLGLNLVHRIITGHNGTITVESQIGIGTTFLIKLPAA